MSARPEIARPEIARPESARPERIGARGMAAASLVLVSVVTGLAGGTPSAHAASTLDGAKKATQSTSYSGDLAYRWSDSGGVHETTVRVSVDHGVVRADGGVGVETDPRGTYVRRGERWDLVWPGPGGGFTLAPPDAGAKYTERSADGPTVAGRPTREVTLAVGAVPRFRLDLDRATGVLLRQVSLDAGGATRREVAFSQITFGAGTSSQSAGPQGLVEADRDQVPVAMSVDGLPSPYVAPSDAGAGFHKIGVYRRPAAVQILYSDGVARLSIFEQAGAIDARIPVGAAAGIRSTWQGGTGVEFRRGGVLFTVVGDVDPAELLEVADHLGDPPSESVGQRLRGAARHLVEAVTGA